MTRLAIAIMVAGVTQFAAAADPATGPTSQPTCIRCEPKLALRATPLQWRGSQLVPAPKDCGAVHPRAFVVSTPEEFPVKLLFDAAKPDAPELDLLRLDMTGKGQFAQAQLIPLKFVDDSRPFTNQKYARFGPLELTVMRAGRSIPVVARGFIVRTPSDRMVGLMLGSAIETDCAFGDQRRRIRIIDANGNLNFCDALVAPPAALSEDEPAWPEATPDTVMVDRGDGLFGKDVPKAYLGAPIHLGGKWYKVEAGPGGAKPTATLLCEQTARLKIDQPYWSCELVGKKFAFTLTGNSTPVELPPDEYRLGKHEVRVNTADGKPVTVLGFSESSGRGAKPVVLRAGEETVLPLGPPLRVRPQIAIQGGKVTISAEVLDALGESAYVQWPPDAQPKGATARIIAPDGKEVAVVKMSYG